MEFELQNLTVLLEDRQLISPVSVKLSGGQILFLMGPSGIGKSSLLRAISGNLDEAFEISGDALLNGKSILNLPFGQRFVGMLHQDELLFPHFNVEQNLCFALPRHYAQKDRKRLVSESLEVAQMQNYADAKVSNLSGGEWARIALMRTILSEPKVLLLDEPLARLDEKLKQNFRHWISQLIQNKNLPTIVITHDENDTLNHEVIRLT